MNWKKGNGKEISIRDEEYGESFDESREFYNSNAKLIGNR